MPDQRIGVDTTAVTSPAAGDVMLLVNGASTNKHITPENLKAWIGAAAPGAVTATLTGDGTTTTFPAITHNLGTNKLDVLLLEADGQPLSYGGEYSYTATTTTITVTIDRWGDGVGNSPLANGVTVSVFVKEASGTPEDPLRIVGSVAGSPDLPSSGVANGAAYVTEDDGHAWLQTGSVSAGAVNGFIDLGPVALDVLPLPLYSIDGNTATLVTGETPIATYADLAAFEAAVNPTAQDERVQLAIDAELLVLKARYRHGSWTWEQD